MVLIEEFWYSSLSEDTTHDTVKQAMFWNREKRKKKGNHGEYEDSNLNLKITLVEEKKIESEINLNR